MTDPRGPVRTVVAVISTPESHVVTFDCGHTASWVRHNSARVGDVGRCLTCRDLATVVRS